MTVLKEFYIKYLNQIRGIIRFVCYLLIFSSFVGIMEGGSVEEREILFIIGIAASFILGFQYRKG